MVTHELDIARSPNARLSCATARLSATKPVENRLDAETELSRLREAQHRVKLA